MALKKTKGGQLYTEEVEPVQGLAAALGRQATPLTPAGTAGIGGNKDQAKMAGTPAAKSVSLRESLAAPAPAAQPAAAATAEQKSKANQVKELSGLASSLESRVDALVEQNKQKAAQAGNIQTGQVQLAEPLVGQMSSEDLKAFGFNGWLDMTRALGISESELVKMKVSDLQNLLAQRVREAAASFQTGPAFGAGAAEQRESAALAREQAATGIAGAKQQASAILEEASQPIMVTVSGQKMPLQQALSSEVISRWIKDYVMATPEEQQKLAEQEPELAQFSQKHQEEIINLQAKTEEQAVAKLAAEATAETTRQKAAATKEVSQVLDNSRIDYAAAEGQPLPPLIQYLGAQMGPVLDNSPASNAAYKISTIVNTLPPSLKEEALSLTGPEAASVDWGALQRNLRAAKELLKAKQGDNDSIARAFGFSNKSQLESTLKAAQASRAKGYIPQVDFLLTPKGEIDYAALANYVKPVAAPRTLRELSEFSLPDAVKLGQRLKQGADIAKRLETKEVTTDDVNRLFAPEKTFSMYKVLDDKMWNVFTPDAQQAFLDRLTADARKSREMTDVMQRIQGLPDSKLRAFKERALAHLKLANL